MAREKGEARAFRLQSESWRAMQEIVRNYSAGVAATRSLSPRNEKILWYVQNKGQYIFDSKM